MSIAMCHQPYSNTYNFTSVQRLHSCYQSNHHIMLKDRTSPTNEMESNYTEDVELMENSNRRMERSFEDTGDSDTSSSGRSPSVSSTIPTCVVAPTSSELELDENSLAYIQSRKQREFIPENKKDEHYWEKRRKNNDAARRSREKRRMHDVCLENRIVDLTRDNCKLRNELHAIKKKFGIPLNETIVDEDEPLINKHTYSPNPSIANSPDGTSPGKQVMMGYMPGVTQNSMLSNSTPPPLLQIGSGIPVGFSVPPTNFSTNGQMPLYVALPTSENRNQIQEPSDYSMAAAQTSRSYDQPPPAHSHGLKKETDEEDYESDRNAIYAGNDSQANRPAVSYSDEPIERSIQYSSIQNSDICDDSTQDQPLSLTVRKRVNSFSGNESSTSVSSSDSPLSQSPPSAALPHKLRHKMPTDYKAAYLQNTVFSNPLINGLAQLSEIALAQSGPLPLLKKSPDHRKGSGRRSLSNNPRAHLDPKYIERRRRNNEAARKCRENRKSLTQLREVKSDFLETENSKLRSELDSLQDEMTSLKELITKKKRKEQNSSERS